MNTRHLALFAACAATLSSFAGTAAAEAPLPLARVRLYETGVGYFERSGRIPAGSDASLPIPTGHLDDALKTLVVLAGDSRTTVSGVSFGSSSSPMMALALAGLPEGSGTIGYAELLSSLEGAPVEIQTKGARVHGRLVDVLGPEESGVSECVPNAIVAGAAKPDAACVLTKALVAVVLTDRGEIRRFREGEIVSVRPTDRAHLERLHSALDAVSSRSAQVKRDLRVAAASGSPVTLGYVAEAPVWRATYRLVFGGEASTLQGWALVHNDTEEDWTKVDVELVNGRPDSFLFPIAEPRYLHRELALPDTVLLGTPQLLRKTSGNIWGDQIGESFGAGGLGLSGIGEGGGGRGEGIGLGSVGTVGHGAGTGAVASAKLDIGDLAAIAKADGVESGALFRYALPSAIDVRAHSSALVPFVMESIGTRRIAFFAQAGEPARSAVRIENLTGQTLPAGPIAIFDDGGFAGEARISRTKPKESRIVLFGTDLDVELDIEASRHTDETRLVSLEGDALAEHLARHHEVTYTIVNRSGSARTVYAALPYVSNARVEGADALDFDAEAERGIAAFDVAARTSVKRRIEVTEGLVHSRLLGSLTSADLGELARSKVLPARQKKLLDAARELVFEAEVRRGAKGKRQADLAELDRDITRLREHLAALRTSKTAAQAIVSRLLGAEDEAKAVRRRIGALEREAKARVLRARSVLAGLAG